MGVTQTLIISHSCNNLDLDRKYLLPQSLRLKEGLQLMPISSNFQESVKLYTKYLEEINRATIHHFHIKLIMSTS